MHINSPNDPVHTEELLRFRGLNNVADPMRGADGSTWEWQSTADNVDVTNSEGIARREGYSQFAAASYVTGSFSTFDYSRFYIIDAGALKRVNEDGSTTTLYGPLEGTAYWGELNDIVYLSCGSDKLEVHADNTVWRWGVPVPTEPSVSATTGYLFAGEVRVCLTYTNERGREGGASPAVTVTVEADGGVTIEGISHLEGYTTHIYATEPDGTVFYHVGTVLAPQTAYTLTYAPFGPELTTQFLDEVPEDAKYIAAFGANIYATEYIPEVDQTVVWFSEAQGYHLFNLNSNYFVVPGEVTQLYGSKEVLLATTQNRVFVYNNDTLTQVAEYGAVPGQHSDIGPDGKIYFWTKRGLCSVMPFQNLTEAAISVAPGTHAGGGVIERGGYRKYVAVIHQGGDAYNKR